MIIPQIKQAIRILKNPEKEFGGLNRRPLESLVGDYMRLLIAVAIAAGLFNFLFSFFKSAYLDIFASIDVQYLRMLNYSAGRSVSISFFYVFSGTFLLFILSAVLKPFFRRIKYTNFLGIVLYSMSPLLLFGWIASSQIPLGIWCLFLFAAGIKCVKAPALRKNSIQQRY